MKRIISALLIVITAVSLCACSSGSTEPTVATSAFDTSTQSTTSPVDPVRKSKLMTWKVKINGHSLTVPFEVSKLKKLGFEYKKSGTIEPGKYSIGVYPENDKGRILTSQLWNPTDSPLEYKDCKVGQIKIGLGEGFKVELPEGIKFNKKCTVDLLKKTYGEPDNFIKGKNYYVLKYHVGVYQFIEFFLYKEERMQKYSSLTIENFSFE